jgi:hypothetical protein
LVERLERGVRDREKVADGKEFMDVVDKRERRGGRVKVWLVG